jgi:hypothetical protein
MGAAAPQPSPAIAWQTIDEETVLLDVDGRRLIGLNETGARIWALMDGTRSVDAISRVLADEFETSVETATEDVRAFLEELVQLGAVIF